MEMSSQSHWELHDQAASSTDRPGEATDLPGLGEAATGGIELPRSLTDLLSHEEGMTTLDLGRQIYDNPEMFGPGLRHEWERIVGSESPPQAFSESCAAYLVSPHALHAQHPTQYEFIRDHVFHGSEFATAPGHESATLGFAGRDPSQLAYLDTDYLGRQISVTPNGTFVVATGQRIK